MENLNFKMKQIRKENLRQNLRGRWRFCTVTGLSH